MTAEPACSRPDRAALDAATITGLRAGQRIDVTFACGVRMTSTLRATTDGRLVLDIPGDNFVIRTRDGHAADDIAALSLAAP